MDYNFNEYRFPSSDGKNTIYAEIYTPKNVQPQGIVQLAHGMIDYTGRYTALAAFLTSHGFIFAGHHHLGHGKSVSSPEDFGFFAERDGYKYVIEDVHLMNKHLHKSYPNLPVILLGHSMGSFISRLYAEEYPSSISGLIIHGTGGPNPLVGVGKLLAKLIRSFYGPRHRSELINKIAFGSYNSKYPKEEGHNAWLTRDLDKVADRDTNEFTSFKFTTSGYIDLFTFLAGCNSKAWFKNYPKSLPTIIMSGDMDPVGNYGNGPHYVYKQLMIGGAENVTFKIYEGARHELFNETNADEVFEDILAWISGVVG
jgi:alpha-beta hydrolase superfamily lysophospholipase